MDQNTLMIVGIGIAALLVGFLIWKILRATGLIKSKEEEQEEKDRADLGKADVWDKEKVVKQAAAALKKKYGKDASKKTVAHLADSKRILDIVNNLWDSKGFLNDREDAVFGIFRNLANKLQVNQLAQTFYANKGRDLFGFINNYLDDSEMSTIFKIINSKPII